MQPQINKTPFAVKHDARVIDAFVSPKTGGAHGNKSINFLDLQKGETTDVRKMGGKLFTAPFVSTAE